VGNASVHRLTVEGVGRQLRKFHPDAVRVGDVGEDRLRPLTVTSSVLAPRALKHCDRVLRALHVQTEMADTERPSVRGLQLDEVFWLICT
jgi:hypothetical protein